MRFVAVVCAALALSSFSLYAEEDAPAPPAVSEADAQAATADAGPGLEEEVTIVRGKDTTVEEYRRHGHLYMIKVKPSVGPAYYLMDTDGDGFLETTSSDITPSLLIPNWIIFSW